MRESKEKEAKSISDMRNLQSGNKTRTERDSTLIDFYSTYEPLAATTYDDKRFKQKTSAFKADELTALSDSRNFYQVSFSNQGGLVMPIIIQFTFDDGSTEMHHIPAEIWKMGDAQVTKVFVTNKEVKSVLLDPYEQTADVNHDNNSWPLRHQLTRFELYKNKEKEKPNPMQRAQNAEMEKGIETGIEKGIVE